MTTEPANPDLDPLVKPEPENINIGNLHAKIRFLEEINAGLQRKIDGLTRAFAEREGHIERAEACAKFWRDTADASRAMESRYKATVLGMGHTIADLKLAEADLDADREAQEQESSPTI